MNRRVNIITGPTGSGKSKIAMDRARHNGVIINADSQQTFKHLPTLTASPTKAEKEAIPHKLYNFLDPTEQLNADHWARLAATEIEATLNSGLTPFVVGGTGFYIKALMEGLSEIPEIPDEIRNRVRAMNHQELEKMAPNLDTQRAMRATEVLLATGKPIEWWQLQPKQPLLKNVEFSVEIINYPTEELNARIRTRTGEILDQAIKEVADLTTLNLPAEAPIYKVLGVKAIRKHLAGEITRPELLEAVTISTHQYAKRQRTFFRTQF